MNNTCIATCIDYIHYHSSAGRHQVTLIPDDTSEANLKLIANIQMPRIQIRFAQSLLPPVIGLFTEIPTRKQRKVIYTK